MMVAGEAFRGGLDEPTYATIEGLAARMGLEIDLDGDPGPDSPEGATAGDLRRGRDAAEGTGEPSSTHAGEDAGTLSLATRPWSWVYVDGAYLGPTPLTDVKLSPGYHTLRVERDGFEGYSTTVTVVAGRSLTMPDVILVPEDS
jgi:hypothetical protein